MKQGDRRAGLAAAGGVVVALALVACGGESTADDASYDLTNQLFEIMHHIVEPAAETIWDSAGWIVTVEGEQELWPTTDEGWEAVENAAATLSEVGNLLLMPGRRVEETAWADYARGLTRASFEVMDAAYGREKQALFDAGGRLYEACTACHEKYWAERPVPPEG